MNNHEVDELVADWDEVYKKGQLSLWVLLAIADGKKHAAQVADFMTDATDGFFTVKEQSLYRALRRFDSMGLVSTSLGESHNGGPKHKYYQLTDLGKAVIGRFVTNNVAPLLQPKIQQLLHDVQIKEDDDEKR